MKHLDDVTLLTKTLCESNVFHSLVVQSPPGWGKTSTVLRALNDQKIGYESLGSYSTPLALYHALVDLKAKVLLIDDCGGIFTDPIAMSVLKAATWPMEAGTAREVAWTSSSERVRTPKFDFDGKIILVTNSFPRNADTLAFISRTLHFEMRMDEEMAVNLLMEAASSPQFFPNQDVAKKVSSFLIASLGGREKQVSLRTLRLAYELALSCPDRWQDLTLRLLPRRSPTEAIEKMKESNLPVMEQLRQFVSETGLSRRTFFNYRKKLIGKSANQRGATCTGIL